MENAADEVSVIALVENLELTLPRRLPARFVQQQARPQQARIIELADKESKIALKRQLNLDVEKDDRVATKNNGAAAESAEERESLEILRRLPPGTVLIKQVEAKKEEEQRAMSEERPRKLSQRIRNKKTTPGRPVEVRRNPLRSAAAARKDPTKESRSARQRLLADKRRGVVVPSSAAAAEQQQQQQQQSKRSRNNTPYMNTRSVTRKMHNVGATYEAPTWRDQTEWKEWPVHGMHERPVYHAQFGLAAEYNGRLFASFDGEGYREINAEAHIEIVRVDPRVESLDRLHQLATRHQQQQQQHQQQQQLLQSTVAAARHQQKLGYASLAQAAVFAKDRLRIPAGLCGLGARLHSPFEHLQTSLGLAQQQQQQQQHLEQLRSLERLQHFENLQRLGSRVRLQTAESCQKFATSRLLSKEMFRSLQNATLAHTQQAAATTSQQSPPSKCLIMPRATVAPVTLPLCNVQPFKGNAKGKLFFVRASDAQKKAQPIPEKTSTVTSSAQSSSISWSDVNLRKKLKSSPSIDMLRTYAATSSAALNLKNRQSHLVQQLSRGFPPIRLAESTGIFRPSLQKNPGLREDPGLEYRFGSSTTSTSTEEDHLSEVLDLSKKEAPKEEKMDLDKDEDKGIR